jgi:hypothetical protein
MCNGKDDDCDGAIDEDFPKKGQPCDGTDGDVCKDGTFVCGKGGALVCNDDAATKTEVCNGADDDCDGATDEGFDVGEPCDGGDADLCEDDLRACTADGAGTLCQDKGKAIVEACNGQDDDCDGVTDEGFGLGTACDSSDADLCTDDVVACAALGGGTTCKDQGSALPEVCNGKDDDCDGVTDPQGTSGCKSYWADADKDGYGAGAAKCLCAATTTYKVTNGDDCDDGNAAVKPGGSPLCGSDGDCDGSPLDLGEACDDGNSDVYDGCMWCNPFAFVVAEDASYEFAGIDVAGHPDGGFVVGLSRSVDYPGDTKPSVLAARFTPDGEPSGGLVTLSKSSIAQPVRVARHAAASLFVWSTYMGIPGIHEVNGAVLKDDGTASNCTTYFSQATQEPTRPPVVCGTGAGKGVAVWSGWDVDEPRVFRRHASSPCAPVASTLSAAPAFEPALVEAAEVGPASAPGYVIATRDAAAAGASTTIRVQRYGSNGAATTAQLTVATAPGDTTIWVQPVRWGDGFLVLWCDMAAGLFAKQYSSSGALIGGKKTLYAGQWGDKVLSAASTPGALFIFAGTPATPTSYVRMLRFDGIFAKTHDELVSFPDIGSGVSSVRAATTADGVVLGYLSQVDPFGPPIAFALRIAADGTLRYR